MNTKKVRKNQNDNLLVFFTEEPNTIIYRILANITIKPLYIVPSSSMLNHQKIMFPPITVKKKALTSVTTLPWLPRLKTQSHTFYFLLQPQQLMGNGHCRCLNAHPLIFQQISKFNYKSCWPPLITSLPVNYTHYFCFFPLYIIIPSQLDFFDLLKKISFYELASCLYKWHNGIYK